MTEKTMNETILWAPGGAGRKGNDAVCARAFSDREITSARKFHSTMPGYEPTPLRRLKNLAGLLGVKDVYVKDESYRFGLNSFKVLGCSYAIAKRLWGELGAGSSGQAELPEMTYGALVSPEMKEMFGDVTFATTTDGNHGRAVAWTGRMLRQKVVVYMPKGSSHQRYEAIASEGAQVTIRDVNYDESVRLTAEEAREKGWIVVQDTAWEGYRDIPLWIMQGYGASASEALDQIRAAGSPGPTHVFIQAGVGSLAGAVQGFFRAHFGETAPKVIVTEASKADCYYRSAFAGDGRPRFVEGDLDTFMVGLACGEPNPIAFEILMDYASAFVSCPDYVSARGMRMLGNPLDGDPRVCSGESGAVTAGLLSFVMLDGKMKDLRDALGLDENSTVLLFSTEGDTDQERYRSVVWDGELPTAGLFKDA
jgi:diaminopropionate ammonia-lyase